MYVILLHNLSQNTKLFHSRFFFLFKNRLFIYLPYFHKIKKGKLTGTWKEIEVEKYVHKAYKTWFNLLKSSTQRNKSLT